MTVPVMRFDIAADPKLAFARRFLPSKLTLRHYSLLLALG